MKIALRLLCFLSISTALLAQDTPLRENALLEDTLRNHTDLLAGIHEPTWVSNGGALQPVYFHGDDVVVNVRLDSGAPGHEPLYPRYWPTQLQITLSDEEGNVIRQRPEFFAQSAEQIRTESDVDGSRHGAEVKMRYKSLPVGKYAFNVVFHGLHAKAGWWIVRGDESSQIRDRKLERDSQHVTDFVEFKRIAMQRLEINPDNAIVLGQLAEWAEKAADLDETRGYYEAALRILRKNTPNGHAVIEQNERVLRLLPFYYADRKNLYIERHPIGETQLEIRLMDRRTGKPVPVKEQ